MQQSMKNLLQFPKNLFLLKIFITNNDPRPLAAAESTCYICFRMKQSLYRNCIHETKFNVATAGLDWENWALNIFDNVLFIVSHISDACTALAYDFLLPLLYELSLCPLPHLWCISCIFPSRNIVQRNPSRICMYEGDTLASNLFCFCALFVSKDRACYLSTAM